jgi:hypothetical protein
MHHEGHNTGSQDIVLHPRVPGGPQPLCDIELGVVLSDFFELTPVGP